MITNPCKHHKWTNVNLTHIEMSQVDYTEHKQM
uniref:Uncharacterized protein n=1 Tax=Rhizophora mucronata TaxID=61149 RepID=A0A2P2PVH5_RHIMU